MASTTVPNTPSTMPATGTSTGGDARRAAGGEDDMFGRAVRTAHETIDRVAETAEPHVRHLQEGMHTARDKLRATTEGARETGDEWIESLRTTVRDHPLATVATALAVGMLLARMTR